MAITAVYSGSLPEYQGRVFEFAPDPAAPGRYTGKPVHPRSGEAEPGRHLVLRGVRRGSIGELVTVDLDVITAGRA